MKQPVSNYDRQVDIAKGIFMEYDHRQLIRKFGLEADEAWICLTYLNTPCRISLENGGIEEHVDAGWRECRSYDTVMTIYVSFIDNAAGYGKMELSNRREVITC